MVAEQPSSGGGDGGPGGASPLLDPGSARRLDRVQRALRGEESAHFTDSEDGEDEEEEDNGSTLGLGGSSKGGGDSIES